MAKTPAFEIDIGAAAEKALMFFEVKDRREIFDSIDLHLKHRPNWETHKIKRLRPNPLATWELRLGDFRVLYDVDEANLTVLVKTIGEKRGNKLFVRGEEFHEHESD